MSASIEMPKYQCHKKVWALKIKRIVINSHEIGGPEALLFPCEDEYAAIEVDAQYMNKHKPQEGGYYVVYDDGYKSFSPSGFFESGYTLIPLNLNG